MRPRRKPVGWCSASIAVSSIVMVAVLAAPVSTAGAATATRLPLSWAIDAPVLGRGATGPAVVTWQEAMNRWLDVIAPADPFRLTLDGDYGPLTDSVTRQFQFAQQLPIDGLVGPVTRAAYLSAPELVAAGRTPVAHAPALAPGDRGAEVAAWQEALNRWTLAAGEPIPRLVVDGIYGPATEAAVRAFQAAQGVTVDGLAGPESRAALFSAPALVNVAPSPSPSSAPRTPAAGVCSVDDAAIVQIELAVDVAVPRCVVMSGSHRLRVVNEGPATHVELGALKLDLDAGGTITSALPVGAYVGPGVHTLEVSRYGGSGPDVQVR